MMSIKHLTFIVVSLLLLGSFQVSADEYLLSEKTYKALNSAQDLMEAEQYQQAGQKLDALLGSTKSGSYDQAVVLQTIGYLYSAQEQYKKAADAFEKALAANALPEQVTHNLRFNLAQLLIADGQYKRGIALMETWLGKADKVENRVYVMLASAYYRLDNYKKVVDYISKAIKNDADAKEDWYRMLLSAHMNLKHYKSAMQVLETLITQYPYKKVYWDQLAALYLQQKKEVSALAVKMLAQRLDMGDADTLLNICNMYRYLEIPYKAGVLLEKGIADGVIPASFDNLQKLADSWLAAREADKAITVFQKMLSKDDSGATQLKLGQVYIAQEQWQPALEVLSDASAKLQGEEQGKAILLLGMAYFHLNQLTDAKAAFSKAISYKEQSRQAGQWLRHIEDLLEKADDAAA